MSMKERLKESRRSGNKLALILDIVDHRLIVV